VTLADSAGGSQSAAPKTAPNSSAAVPATIDLATLLAEVPQSIVPGSDVMANRLFSWLMERTKGRRLRYWCTVRRVVPMSSAPSGYYARMLDFKSEQFVINGKAIGICPGYLDETSNQYSIGLLFPSLSGDDALRVDAFDGRKLSLTGKLIYMVAYPNIVGDGALDKFSIILEDCKVDSVQ